jgi:hypothetical protein
MRTLSDNTDGLTIISNDLAGGLRKIVDDVSAYYVIGYTSTNAKADGSYRRIEVKIDRPKVRVRARRGYVAPVAAPVRTVGTSAPASTVPEGVTDALGVRRPLRACNGAGRSCGRRRGAACGPGRDRRQICEGR